MSTIENMTLSEARKLLDSREVSSRELVEAYADRARRSTLNTYLEVFEDSLAEAEAVDKARTRGDEPGALAGIPITLKDNILVEGKRASAASKILDGYTATYDSTAARKLKDAGAIFLGRANMDEFAMGSSTENSAFGVTKNPHDETRVSGGSSGGSAAAVAADEAIAALGSDTGGSVRQPAAFCGVVGLKPTYGAISRYGLMALGSSLDQIGPLTKTVDDAELLFGILKGRDPMDSTTKDFDTKTKKVEVIGVPRDILDIEGLEPDVKENFSQMVKGLEGAGYEIRDVSLPNLAASLGVYYIIMPAEASSNLARFDGQRYGLSLDGDTLYDVYTKTRGQGFGKEVRRRIILGTYVLSSGYYDAYYRKAVDVRELISADFRNAFEGVQAIALPTTPTPTFKIGEKTEDPLSMYLSDVFTVPANIAGIPALSVPSGNVLRDGEKLPLGFQILAPWGGEDNLFSVGRSVEEIRNI